MKPVKHTICWRLSNHAFAVKAVGTDFGAEFPSYHEALGCVVDHCSAQLGIEIVEKETP